MIRCLKYYEQGFIKPITPMKEFPALQIQDGMRYIQRGQHIGKVVITMPEKPQDLPLENLRKGLSLHPDKSYLFVGGLGGLGRSIANWLVERGAKHIVFFSRSAGKTPQSDAFFQELEAQGCVPTAFSGSVCNYDDVQRVVNSIKIPIGGVLQASMVLDVSLTMALTSNSYSSHAGCRIYGNELRAMANGHAPQSARDLEPA
jgi:hypothetical protein